MACSPAVSNTRARGLKWLLSPVEQITQNRSHSVHCWLLGAHLGLHSQVRTTNTYIPFKVKSVGEKGLLLCPQYKNKKVSVKKKGTCVLKIT